MDLNLAVFLCECECAGCVLGGGGVEGWRGVWGGGSKVVEGAVLVPSVRRAGANKEHRIMNGTLICFSLARSL